MTAPGTLISGRYRLVRPVGAGGMGSVWEGWDELLHRRVAIKQLLPQPGLSVQDATTARDRVIREARNTARLHHPNAVTLYDVVGHDGRPCLIMQFVPSVTLSTLVRTEGPIQPQFAARIGAELAAALGAAHEVGIIHRDVKPGNVLITDDSSAKLTDFGVSHAVGDATLTSAGMVSGTPAFLAPEVARGAASGFATDVYSLGATLYAAMEGGPPSGTDANPMAVLHRVASGQLTPPERSGRLTPLVMQMLAYDPAARPSIAEITETLTRLDREFTGGPAVAAPPVVPATQVLTRVRGGPPVAAGPLGAPTAVELASVAELAPPERRRRSGLLPVAVFAAVVIAAIVIGVFVVTRNSGEQASPPAPGTSASTASASRAPGSSTSVRTSGASAAPPAASSSSDPPARTTAAANSAALPPAGSSSSSSTSSSSSSVSSSSVSSSSVSSSSVSSSSVSSSSTTTRSSASSSAGTPSNAELARAITEYYALLPDDTDAAWERLSANFQSSTAVDRQYYERFWNSIDKVTIRGAEGSVPDTAGAQITYYFKDGRVAVEATLFTLVRDGDGLDIDTSNVLTSEVR